VGGRKKAACGKREDLRKKTCISTNQEKKKKTKWAFLRHRKTCLRMGDGGTACQGGGRTGISGGGQSRQNPTRRSVSEGGEKKGAPRVMKIELLHRWEKGKDLFLQKERYQKELATKGGDLCLHAKRSQGARKGTAPLWRSAVLKVLE